MGTVVSKILMSIRCFVVLKLTGCDIAVADGRHRREGPIQAGNIVVTYRRLEHCPISPPRRVRIRSKGGNKKPETPKQMRHEECIQ